MTGCTSRQWREMRLQRRLQGWRRVLGRNSHVPLTYLPGNRINHDERHEESEPAWPRSVSRRSVPARRRRRAGAPQSRPERQQSESSALRVAEDRRADAPQSVELPVHRQLEEATERALGDDPCGQGVAKACDGLHHPRGEIKQAEHLAHACTGNPERSCEIGAGRAVPVVEHPLPRQGEGQRITVLLGELGLLRRLSEARWWWRAVEGVR